MFMEKIVLEKSYSAQLNLSRAGARLVRLWYTVSVLETMASVTLDPGQFLERWEGQNASIYVA
jgi:hypothetical protein